MRGGQSYAVNGMRPESNEFLVDGAENYNTINAGFVLKPPPDAIAEFRILTNTASAEFGHNAGSNTNIVTRSGSNQIHGDVYEFLRNDAVDARNFFSTNAEPLKQNQFGGTLGGPIRARQDFPVWFLRRISQPAGRNPIDDGSHRRRAAGELLRQCASYHPRGFCTGSHRNAVGRTCSLRRHNLSPSTNSRRSISPISQNLLAFYPLPNAPNYGPNAYGATQELQNTSDQFGLRLDHYISSRDTISFHYLFNNGSQLDPLSIAGANVPGFPVGENFRAQNAALEETHSFSPARRQRGSFLLLCGTSSCLAKRPTTHRSPRLGFQYSPTLRARPDLLSLKSAVMPRSAIPSPGRRTTIRIPFLSRTRWLGFAAGMNSSLAASFSGTNSTRYWALPRMAFSFLPRFPSRAMPLRTS